MLESEWLKCVRRRKDIMIGKKLRENMMNRVQRLTLSLYPRIFFVCHLSVFWIVSFNSISDHSVYFYFVFLFFLCICYISYVCNLYVGLIVAQLFVLSPDSVFVPFVLKAMTKIWNDILLFCCFWNKTYIIICKWNFNIFYVWCWKLFPWPWAKRDVAY